MAKMPLEAGSTKGGIRLKRWLIGLLIFLLASLLVINSFTIGQFRIIPLGTATNQANDADASRAQQELRQKTLASIQNGYAVNTKGCQIPDLSPFEPSSMKYIDKAKPIICEHGSHLPLIDSNNSAIFVNPEARAHYYNETEIIDCCWRSFWRSDNKDNDVTVSKDCHPFQEAAFINDEFIRVECQRHNESVYRDYFAFAPRKLHVEERCRKYQQEIVAQQPQQQQSRQLGVLVVGVDSLSRLNFRRSMPKTLNLLKKLGALEMLGYHKVADNTYPNLVPVFTGLSQLEFEKLCWTNHKKPFDRCPFLWKNFMAKGYRTIFGEDACHMTTFNYLKPGFRVQPTDYYLRPFCVAAESEIGNTHKLNADLCLGTRYNYVALLHYTRKVAEEFAKDPYFGFFWQASLTHDYIEYPQLADDEYHDFFDYLDKFDLMRNTAVFFMSDHGMRWGSFRQTYQGRLEDSLPTMFITMPDWWKKRYPDAWRQLQTNSKRLTTPFDMYETLWDILDPSRLVEEKESNNIPAHNSSINPRGISMFRAIPEERNCEAAGIPEHWCMCHVRYNVSHDDPIIEKLTDFLVQEINAMLSRHRECAKLQFHSLVDAKALSAAATIDDDDDNDEKKKSNKSRPPPAPWIDYTVTIETIPGNAIFEGSIRHNASFNLIGSISRLNAYGKQSACVDDFHLRLYCYCLQ